MRPLRNLTGIALLAYTALAGCVEPAPKQYVSIAAVEDASGNIAVYDASNFAVQGRLGTELFRDPLMAAHLVRSSIPQETDDGQTVYYPGCMEFNEQQIGSRNIMTLKGAEIFYGLRQEGNPFTPINVTSSLGYPVPYSIRTEVGGGQRGVQKNTMNTLRRLSQTQQNNCG